MKKNIENIADGTERLRKKAENLLRKKPSEKTIQLSEAELLKLPYELEVCKMEIEMQFDELVRNKAHDDEALLENNLRLDLVMQAGNVAWWEMDRPTGKVTFGKRKAEMLGYPAKKFTHYTDFTNLIHPEDHEKVMSAMRKHLSGLLDNYEVEYRMKVKSGEYKWFYDRGAALSRDPQGNPKKITGIVFDITERKQAEAALQESEEKFKSIYDGSNDAIMLLNENGFFDCNPKTLELFGFENNIDFLKCQPWELSPPAQPDGRISIEAAGEQIHNALQQGRNHFNWVHRRSNGEDFPVKVHLSSIRLGGKSVLQATIRDITKVEQELIEANKELVFQYQEKEKRAAELIVANKELVFQNQEKEKRAAELIVADIELDFQNEEKEKRETANMELEAFSYSVSHDLRAPLRHIGGFVDLLIKNNSGQLDTTGLRYLNIIEESTREMGNLIDALLTFSRLSRTELQRSKINMTSMINQVINTFSHEFSGRIIEINVPELPHAMGDEILINQVWVNLISNALKYSRNKEKTVIDIGGLVENDKVKFFIKDNGAGFDMKYANKLFGVFQRLHKARDFEGIGIGLANVNRIIVRHGGKCWAESEVGQGATFFFTMKNNCQPFL
jgi:PAS domain S-box-containing protein